MKCFDGEARCSTDADLAAAVRIYMIRCPQLRVLKVSLQKVNEINEKMNLIKHQKRREELRMNLAKSE